MVYIYFYPHKTFIINKIKKIKSVDSYRYISWSIETEYKIDKELKAQIDYENSIKNATDLRTRLIYSIHTNFTCIHYN